MLNNKNVLTLFNENFFYADFRFINSSLISRIQLLKIFMNSPFTYKYFDNVFMISFIRSLYRLRTHIPDFQHS